MTRGASVSRFSGICCVCAVDSASALASIVGSFYDTAVNVNMNNTQVFRVKYLNELLPSPLVFRDRASAAVCSVCVCVLCVYGARNRACIRL